MNPPTINRFTVRNHFSYQWWLYLLMLIASIFLWNLLYTTTAYKSPENLRIDWYYQDTLSQDAEDLTQQYLNGLKETTLPEVETFTITQAGTDETYGNVQLTTWMAAGQGDLYQLKKDTFQSYADAEAFIDLTPYIEDGTLNIEGAACLYADLESVKHCLVGVSAEQLEGLSAIGLEGENMYFGILANCGNERNTVILLNTLLESFSSQSETR